MKRAVKLSAHVTATLYTGSDVPKPRSSPLLEIETTEYATEGLGGYGPPDSVMVAGEDALARLAELLASRTRD